MNPEPLDMGTPKLSFCLGHGPRTERARVYSSFPHDALLVLFFTAPVLRQEITYHRPSQASFLGGTFRWLNIRNNSHSVIHYSCKIYAYQILGKLIHVYSVVTKQESVNPETGKR